MFWIFKTKKEDKAKGPALSCVHNGRCSKELCPLWVVFDRKNPDGTWQHKPEGKCTMAWTPTLLVELRDTMVMTAKTQQKPS